MKVLLTGASGFLGHYVLASLHRLGIDVVALGRQPLSASPGVSHVTADLLAAENIAGLVAGTRATHLLHLAWYAEHGKFWTSPINLHWVEATTRLVEAFCQSGGSRVVAAGTCAEYDWAEGYCREDSTPLVPATLYGTAKDRARRQVAEICKRHDIACAWGRIFLPFGTGEDHRRLIPSLIEVFQGRRPPFGVNAPAARDFIHASDVADGLVALLVSEAEGDFNVSSGQAVTIGQVVEELARQLRADADSVLGLTNERPGEPPLLVGDNAKLRALGWAPEVSLAEGLARTVRQASLRIG